MSRRKNPGSLELQSIANFLVSLTARATLIRSKLHTAKEGTVMISQKAKARKEAEKARQQALLIACGYSALKRKHRASLRPALPDLKVKQVAR
jgi:hypothetical protein